VEDTCASPFWLRCVDCGGAVATATPPEVPDALVTIARPFLKVIAMKLNLSSEARSLVTGDDPFALLGDAALLPALFSLRCADCTVKINENIAAA